MGTYNGCLLILLTALQDLSYEATAESLVRPWPGFIQGYTNTTPPCAAPTTTSITHKHKIISKFSPDGLALVHNATKTK